MSAILAPGIETIVRACGAGRFVPFFRNRPIGSETVRAETGPSGPLRLRSETEITVNRFSLRQTVIAGFTADLRPEWCTVDACVNSRRMSLEVEIGRDRALTRYRSGEQVRPGRCELARPPLTRGHCHVAGRDSAPRPLGDDQVMVRVGSDLREVGDDEDLPPAI